MSSSRCSSPDASPRAASSTSSCSTGAPSLATYSELAVALRAMPRVPITEAVVDRALAVQAQLASTSEHRSVPLPDLLITACAEAAGLTVLHYDADYERISSVTGQPEVLTCL